MSSTTNTPYMVKSMNSIISISDGAGVTIENGVITAPTIDLTNLNIDEIQGTAPINNIDLYTNSLGSVDLGAATTAIVNINATDTNILAANSLYMNSGTTTSILASTINLVSNEIVVGGGQTIYQNDLSQDFTIGGNATTRNFYLGNLTVPPQVPFSANTGFDVVNYDTCVALIASGGGSSTLYADDIYMFTPGVFASLWADNTAGFAIGSNTIINTATQSMGTNNGSLALATISNRSADTFIATGQNHSGNIYLGSGQNSTGNIYIACNNYTGPSGVTTGSVYIGGVSTSTRYNGTVNICAFLPSAGTNNVNIGSSSTVNTHRGSSLNLNSTNATNNVVTIGSANTTSLTMVSADINVNSTNGTSNTVDIGSAQTTANHFGTQINLNSGNGTANTVSVGSLATTTLTDVAQTIAINSTNGNSNIINIGSTTSTINLGSSTATVINSYPITPAMTSYNATTGTNIAGTIGQIIATSTLTNSAIGTTTYPTERVINYPTISITDNGVWMISCTVPYENTAIGVAYRALLNLIVDTTIVARTTNMTSINTNQGQINNPYYNSLCTVVVITAAPKTIQPEGRYIFGSGTWRTGTTGFELRAVRIA
jgi:hypothetical protein